VAEVLNLAEVHGHHADLLEIRLDLLMEPEIAVFVEALDLPLLFTNRPRWEGGAWDDSEEDRVGLLLQAVASGAQYVDIELRASSESFARIIRGAAGTDCKTITSWHDFQETPDQHQLLAVLQKMAESGADMGKIVTTAHDYTDALRVLSLQIRASELNFPLACFAMGSPGQMSRIATLGLGGVLTYGAADSASCTAPGQLTVAELRSVQEILQ
jgi:3-dehydroquinate dehydratase-1/3-dehydroquinate dehydratase/shikimate dehydrogenase